MPLPRIAIYTAIFGSYEDLKPQPRTPGADFYCFTDDPQLEAEPWVVAPRKTHHSHPRLAAKWFKMFPHRVLPSYAFTLYVDGSVQLRNAKSVGQLVSYLGPTGMALFPHPDRDNIYDEAQVSAQIPKNEGQPVREQVEAYRRTGLPDQHSLLAGTVLVRSSRVRRIRRLGRLWWKENLRWTYHDQLSLPYVLWRLRLTPDLIPHNLWSNPFFVRDISARPFEYR